jgi:hypothetical protein
MTKDATKQGDPILVEWVSPLVLKMITENSKYKMAYKSYAFGLIHKIAAKWLYVLIAGVVVFVLILYFSGTISFQGR